MCTCVWQAKCNRNRDWLALVRFMHVNAIFQGWNRHSLFSSVEIDGSLFSVGEIDGSLISGEEIDGSLFSGEEIDGSFFPGEK